ncbi:DUF7109 family protein [Halomarina litorea]|uniref:DUF7109 family protein n=1 Tax=Halomarina litorea TaxID=2961595 RepID=UPI0020C5247E|nr:hypothetical protein [Halomarina sp. BCD28]
MTDDAPGTFAVDADDLAGVVDLFGALTRAELLRALEELAFKAGVDPPDESVVDDALASYHLVEHDGSLVPGPVAFPALPEGAGDLPHIMDVGERSPDREAVGRTVEERFRGEAARALGEGGPERIDHLLDVSYDLETWGPVEVADVRRRLDAARADEES